MIDKPKRKNDDIPLTSYDQAWLFRLYCLMEWHQTRQIRIDASPGKRFYRSERLKTFSIYSPRMKCERARRRWKHWHRTGQMRLHSTPEKAQHCIRHLRKIHFFLCQVEQKITADRYEFQVSVSEMFQSRGQGTITGYIRSGAGENTIVLRAYPAIGNVIAFVFLTVLCVPSTIFGLLYAEPASKLILLGMCSLIVGGWWHMTKDRNIALDIIPKAISMIPKPLRVPRAAASQTASDSAEVKSESQGTWLSSTSSSTNTYMTVERNNHDFKAQK